MDPGSTKCASTQGTANAIAPLASAQVASPFTNIYYDITQKGWYNKNKMYGKAMWAGGLLALLI